MELKFQMPKQIFYTILTHFLAASYTYNKHQKLKSRKVIAALFQNGKSLHASPVRVIYTIENKEENNASISKAAVSVSSRHFKKAVQRNRIKRLLRECWRLEKNKLESVLIAHQLKATLFFVYTGTQMPELVEINQQTKKLIERISKTISCVG